MLEADGNVIDEFASVFHQSTNIARGRGHLAVTGNSLMAGKASFDGKIICLNEFFPGL